MKRCAVAVLAWVCVVCGACATPSQFQSARVLPKGETRVSVAAQLHQRQDAFASTSARQSFLPELQLRQGVLEDRLECGAKFFGFGVKGDCKFQFLKTRWLDISGAPGVGFTSSFLSAHIVDGYLSVLAGLNLWREPYDPGGVSLVGSMTVVGRCFVAEGRDPQGCFAQRGFSAGLHVQVTDAFALMPEVSTLMTIGRPRESFGPLNGPWVQAGISLQFRKPERDVRPR